MKKIPLPVILLLLSLSASEAQNTGKYQLNLYVPFLDLPQNAQHLRHQYPSMRQSLEISSDLYELEYWGIDKLGDRFIKPEKGDHSQKNKLLNAGLKYLLSAAFVKLGSELPIPLGVWAHEEYHRSVLGLNKIHTKNGNWLLHRWDGTVYGVSDEQLSALKRNQPDELLYAYAAGIQSEITLTRKVSVQDFYKPRTLPKNALVLYNAWYVWDYFKFAVSPITDSLKIRATKTEDKDPLERDFAENDLTAWAYDVQSGQTLHRQRQLPGRIWR